MAKKAKKLDKVSMKRAKGGAIRTDTDTANGVTTSYKYTTDTSQGLVTRILIK